MAAVGICTHCRNRVPAEHVIRDNQVFLRKDCPTCGAHEVLVSTNAAVWQWKREVYEYDPASADGCTLNCTECALTHHQTLAFLDVTSRCNLNCPICIANIPGMGVDFHPSLEYFEKVLGQLAQWKPKPRICLFGGEPTVRKDLFEIIQMAKGRKMRVSLVTNGLALANEDYCKRVCQTGIEVLLAFDGRDPAIYERMRGSSRSYDLKMKAIDNLQKHSRRGHTWVCTLALGVNDQHMPDLFRFTHEHRSIIRRLFFIPLTEMWEAGRYETSVMTTPEDVERLLQASFPGEPLEFVPAGFFGRLQPGRRFFTSKSIHLGSVHPNCESIAFLVSDGERWHPVGQYLKRPVREFAAAVAAAARKVNPRFNRLDPERWFQRWRGRLLALRTSAALALRFADSKKLLKGNRALRVLRILGSLALGRRPHDVLRRHLRLRDLVTVTVLPFEEWHSVDPERMRQCAAVFAYLDPDTERVATVPFCMWSHYRTDAFQRMAATYPPVKEAADECAH